MPGTRRRTPPPRDAARLLRGLALLALVGALPATLEGRQISLSTLEGEVVLVRSISQPGELTLVAVELRHGESGADTLVSLAPVTAYREIGLEVAPGDRLRVHVFTPVDSVTAAQKVLNLSRGTATRLRTLTGIPLWSGDGTWQGGDCQYRPGAGPHGLRYRRRVRGGGRPEEPGRAPSGGE